MKRSLFSDEEEEEGASCPKAQRHDSEEPAALKVNRTFAKLYNQYREKEHYQHLKHRFADRQSDSDDDTSSEEEVPPDAIDDTQFLKVLTAIRNKDPSIYDKSHKFFDDELPLKKKDSKPPKEAPVTLKDYALDMMTSGKVQEIGTERMDINLKPTYTEEQNMLKEEVTAAIKSMDSGDEDLLVKRQTEKPKGNPQNEDEIQKWLEENRQKFSKKERNLLQYLLDPSNADDSENDDVDPMNVPTYDEIVKAESEAEEEFDQIQDMYEKEYNFRFETPGGNEIKTYPRNVPELVRQDDSKRAEKRKEAKEKRKQIELQREEEFKRFKALKRRELMSKIEKLQKQAGVEDLPVDPDLLNSEFDPDAHDKLMSGVFNQDYYEEGEDEEKPRFSDDDEDAINDTNQPSSSKIVEENGQETDNAEEDEDNESEDAEEIIKRSAKDKPLFDPKKETFEEYLFKHYDIDLNDVVEKELPPEKPGKQPPPKFKYRKVQEDSYGLTIDEILQAPVKELNKWVSVKKVSQYRSLRDELYDKTKYQNIGRNKMKKAKVFQSLYQKPDDVPDPGAGRTPKPKSSHKTKGAKGKKKNTNLPGVKVSDDRLKAYGIQNTKSFKHYLKNMKAKSKSSK